LKPLRLLLDCSKFKAGEVHYINLGLNAINFVYFQVLQLPDTLIPEEYHIVKNKGVIGIEYHEE
jgi:hypothetical protein